jgi:hypothetical protein
MTLRHAAGAAGLAVALALAGQHYLSSTTPHGGRACAEAQARSSVLLCDDFESAGFEKRWDIGGHQGLWPVNEFVKCADGFGFRDRCAAWSNKLSFDREWGFYGYDAQARFETGPEFYVRWYQYVSDPYVWGSLEDKSVMLHDADHKVTAYVATNRNHRAVEKDSGPGMPFVANYQDVDVTETNNQYNKVNRFQNQKRNITLTPGRWYYFEWHVKLNTPGEANGSTRLWIDDATKPISTPTLRMQYDDMRWLRKQDAGRPFSMVRLTVYHQRCDGTPNTCPPNGPWILNQWQRWDRLVVSRTPVGPMAEERSR